MIYSDSETDEVGGHHEGQTKKGTKAAKRNSAKGSVRPGR